MNKGKTLKQITNTPKSGLKELSELPFNEDFIIELISKNSGKKYTANKDILTSSSSGGGAVLFPNGVEYVTESRDLTEDDNFKILRLAQDVVITVPVGISIPHGGRVALVPNGTGCAYVNQNGTFNILWEGGVFSEFLLFDSFVFEGQTYLTNLSTGEIKINEVGSTLNKYLYDNMIPITGTRDGSPVTGDIEFLQNEDNSPHLIYVTNGTLTTQIGLNLSNSFLSFENADEAQYNSIIAAAEGIYVSSDNINARGLIGNLDYSSNITNVDYTQKIYVDRMLGLDTVTLNTDDPLVYSGDTLYVPAGKGKINLTGSTGQGNLSIVSIVTSTPQIPLTFTKTVSGTQYEFSHNTGNLKNKNFGGRVLYIDDVDYIIYRYFPTLDKFIEADFYTED